MSDLIDRKKVIQKLREHRRIFCHDSYHIYEFSILSKDEKARVDEIDNCIATIINLPSAEPERKRKFLKIVVEYPEICTYPEFKGKPYYSIMYEENGETIVGFGTYKPEVLSQYLREYFLLSAEPERTAKVVRVDKKNFKCLNCCQNFHAYMWAHPTNYCSFCGAKLDWSGNETD